MALEHPDGQMGQSAQEITADADYEALITRGAALRPRIAIALTALLGEGSFGAVYEASWRDGRDEQICVKRCRLAGLSDAEQRQLRREVCLHAELSHPNLNALVGAFTFDGCLHVVLHRCAGDLATALAEGAELVAEIRLLMGAPFKPPDAAPAPPPAAPPTPVHAPGSMHPAAAAAAQLVPLDDLD